MLQITATADLSLLSKGQLEAFANLIHSFIPVIDTAEEEERTTFTGLVSQDEPSPETAFTSTGPVLVNTENDRLDKSGLPWDERIHASTRVKTVDGLWRKRRGIDDATVATVEAELKKLMAIPSPDSMLEESLQRAALATAPIALVPAPPPVEAMVPSVPVPPAALVPAPPPPATPVADRAAFVALITLASGAIGAKKLTQEQLTAAVVAAGVPSLPLLGNRLDLVPQVTSAIQTIIECAA